MRRAFVLALFLVGCAHGPGATWRSLGSQHLELITDESSESARQTLDECEAAAQRLSEVVGLGAPSQRLRIVLFEHQEAFHEIVPRQITEGEFRHGMHDHVPTMVLYSGGSIVDLLHTVQHELVHWLINHALPRVPAWLHEGLASYYQTAERDVDTGELTLGASAAQLAVSSWPPVSELIGADPEHFYGPAIRANYSASWGLVYTLLATHADAFHKLVDGLSARQPFEDAWASAGLDADALDKEERELFLRDRPFARKVKAPLPTHPDPEWERTLSPAETQVLLARLRGWDEEKPRAAALAELTEAQRLAPDSSYVGYWRAAFDTAIGQLDEARRLLSEVLIREPSHAEARGLQVEIMLFEARNAQGEPDLGQLDAAIAELRALTVDAPKALAWAAETRLLHHDLDGGNVLVDQAIAKDPLCVTCLDARWRLQFAAKHWDMAADTLKRALRIASGDEAPELVGQLQATLKEATSPSPQ
jgi:hypothetical protein